MLAGIVLIVAGVLLVIYPPLLSIIVVVFLIAAGAMVISIAHFNRKNHRHYENPTVEFFQLLASIVHRYSGKEAGWIMKSVSDLFRPRFAQAAGRARS
jgi:ABC-type bacteriocin/lantibiotic exporter with double-glycine peptidase domain